MTQKRVFGHFLTLGVQNNELIWISTRYWVRATGIAPIRLSAPDPKSGLSTNFNTPAIALLLEKECKFKTFYRKCKKNYFLMKRMAIRGRAMMAMVALIGR